MIYKQLHLGTFDIVTLALCVMGYICMLLCRKIFQRINRINSFVCNGFIFLSLFNRLNLKQKSLRTNQFQTTTNWLSFMEKIEQLGKNLNLHRR